MGLEVCAASAASPRALTQLQQRVPGQVLGPGNKGHRSIPEPQPQGPSSPMSRKESHKLVFVTSHSTMTSAK